MLLGAGLLLFPALAASLAAQQPAAFTAFSDGQGGVDISQGGEDYLRFGVGAWGPKWSWVGISGEIKNADGAAAGTLVAKIGGSPVRLDVRAERPAPNRLQLAYALRGEADTDLTLFIAGLSAGKMFTGRELTAESAGPAVTARFPLAKGSLGTSVTALRLVDAAGAPTVLRFDPPCEIAVDGGLRLVLAKDRLPANTERRLAVSVELPGAADWYASVAELPEEPGLAQWYPWQATGDTGPSAIGLEDWLEAPAGKHGRITRQESQLIYHGQPIKLWGLNLCYGACAPEKALAEKRAAFYRKHGINAVRLHKFADNTGWAGIQAKDSCIAYDAPGLDRMDYQVAKFKEAGIYVTLSATFGTLKLGAAERATVPFLEEFGAIRDGRVETPHSAIFYSPELQQVQIQQMVALLQHTNPYTGLTYASDPAVAFVEAVNEQSILFYSSMTPLKASATLRRYIGQRFGDWLRAKYQNQAGLAQAWGKAAFDCFEGEGFKTDGEDLAKNNILPLGNPWYWDPTQLRGSQLAKRQRLLDSLQFLYQLECEFYDRYTAAMRMAGYTGELIGSNWQAGRAYSHYANLHADARMGTVDRHNYFGGERANASMLARAGSGMLSSGMQQVAGHPFMLSEWIHVFPNEYGLEGPALIGAYGLGLQGWDASFMFQNGDDGKFSSQLGRSEWDVVAPQVLGLFPAVARQVYRGDAQEAGAVATRHVSLLALFAGKLGFEDQVAQEADAKELDSAQVPARSLAVARSEVAFAQQGAVTPKFDLKPFEREGGLVSATGQLRWHEAGAAAGGWFTLDSPGTKAVVGFAPGQPQTLGQATLELRSRYGAVYVTALEPGKSLATSRRILVTAMARARNTGMKFSPGGGRMLERGKGPIVLEPVQARVTWSQFRAAKVTLLDHDGRPTHRTLPWENGGCTLDGARDQTPYYLIEPEPSQK